MGIAFRPANLDLTVSELFEEMYNKTAGVGSPGKVDSMTKPNR